MSAFLKSLLGGSAPQQPIPQAGQDADFADFAGAPDPSPVSNFPSAATASISSTSGSVFIPRPYTKWYRVWERATLADFYSELFILPFIIIVIVFHIVGSRANRRKARAWATAHVPVLDSEFALVGFGKTPQVTTGGTKDPMSILKEKSITEYTTYATGRQNIAFTDIKLTIAKRHNPMGRFGEAALGFFFESMPAPTERMEATSFVFDGREADLAPILASKGDVKEKFNSVYDAFVFAIVHKEQMKTLRDGRYDLSLTSTKDHAKLPAWATVMSESAEITETLLTPDLVAAVTAAGEAVFEALIVSDMPIDQPRKLNDAVPRKRISLGLRLPADDNYAKTTPLFTAFLRLADTLTGSGRFRPEALRRVRATREEELKKIRRLDETEKSEERRAKAEKEKKEEREKKLRGLSADEQRKYLERERAQDLRRGTKKRTMK